MVAPALGADLIVDTGTTTITSSDNYDNTFIGLNANNNRLNVLNPGTVLANSVDVFVGRFSSGNSMVISNGARVVNIDGYIGTFAGLAPNNSVLVTGTGSAWANTGVLNVGFQSSGNTLTVANGGAVSATTLRIATQAGSSGTVNIGSLGGSDTAGSLGTTPITFGAGTGTLNFNQTDTATLTQLISGSTGVNTVSQLGSGTTILSGANTFTGATFLNNGTLVTTTTSALGAGNVTLNAGTIQINSRLNLDGTLDWASTNATVAIGSVQSGHFIDVAGNLSNGGGNGYTFNLTGSSVATGNTVVLLDASNMNTFTADNFAVTGFGNYELSILGSQLLVTKLVSDYDVYAQTPNQVRVATALNGFQDATSGDRTTVTTALDSLTTDAQYQAAFEQMMPSIYSSLPTLAFNTANALNTKLFERIWLMQVAGLSGAAVAGDSPTQNNDNNPLGLKADENWSPFVDANGIFASANSGGTLDTYNAQNGGVTTGGMYKFLPNLMAGAYAGYQYTHAGYDGSTSMEDNAARFGLLASWAGETCYRNTDNIYLNGLVGGQMHNYNVDRQIVFSDINRTANATPTGGEFDSAVQVGYNVREGGFTFGPQASLQYTYLGVNSFDESGADSLDLNVDSFNSSSMMFTLGGQGAYRIEVDEDFAVIPMASASWQHECLQNPYGIQSAFATGGPSESFNFQSSAPLRDFFYGGVGVGFAIGQNWQVTVLWNASAANADLASQNVYISAAARF
jgi:T5SS/PEP-CTERM-associated repeat protein/autotransporter-associated beta strand protein